MDMGKPAAVLLAAGVVTEKQLGWAGGEETRTTAEKQTALTTPATAFS